MKEREDGKSDLGNDKRYDMKGKRRLNECESASRIEWASVILI